MLSSPAQSVDEKDSAATSMGNSVVLALEPVSLVVLSMVGATDRVEKTEGVVVNRGVNLGLSDTMVVPLVEELEMRRFVVITAA